MAAVTDVKVSRPTWSQNHFFGLGLSQSCSLSREILVSVRCELASRSLIVHWLINANQVI